MIPATRQLARWRAFCRVAWAAPCSIAGLALAAVIVAAGGRGRRWARTLEFTLQPAAAPEHPLSRILPFRAIALGHVVVATSEEAMAELRAHEQVHVRQYERWGLFFFPAYALSSAWQVLRGRRAYWDNAFEVEARALSPPDRGPAPDTGGGQAG